jgi:carbonic anhydrase
VTAFDDLLSANEGFQQTFQDSGLSGRAARGLAVLTCIDSRIDPLGMLGLRPGEAKIFRNAGARVTDDALRSLVLAVNFLGVERICVVRHTDCAMIGRTDDEYRARLKEDSDLDAAGWEFLAMPDPAKALREDLRKIAACPLIPNSVAVGAFVYDVRTGALAPAAGF